jgi:hypothetical protein
MPQSPLVVSFSDWNYRPVLENWLLHLGLLGIRETRIYCLDARTRDWCQERSVDARLLPWDGNFAGLWKQRLAVFRDLLAEGTELIHSDLDAVWLGNPFAPDSAARRPEDLVFSQGTIWPPDVFQAWSFVLCCGWFWVKPTPAARRFFSDLAQDVATTGDDQISVNRLLKARGIRWDASTSPAYRIVFNGNKLSCWLGPLPGQTSDGELSVAMLPHRQYQRLPEAGNNIVVRHLLTPKKCDDKIAALRAFGLWKLG